MPGPLKNTKHERFCVERVKGKTQDEAYALAGYKPDRGSASRLATNANIQARIAELQQDVAQEAALTASMVLAEMGRIGMSDVRRLFTEDGALKPLHTLDAGAAACISSIEFVTKRAPGAEEAEVEHVTKVKLWDKRAALSDLGKHFGLFTEKHDHSGTIKVEHMDADSARDRIRSFFERQAQGPALPAPGPGTIQ